MVSRRRASGEQGKHKAPTGKRVPRAGKRTASAASRIAAENEEMVMLTLSSAQIEQVLRAATPDTEAGVVEMLTSEQLAGARESRYRALLEDRRLSRSLLAGLLVLTCFPTGGGELGIADLARHLDMRTSTIHRYVSTLLAAGLLERDPVSRQYRLAQQ